MPTLFLKRTKIWQWKYGKFVDLSDPTHFGKHLGKKRLRIFRNNLYCHKLESCWHGSMFVTFNAIIFESQTLLNQEVLAEDGF